MDQRDTSWNDAESHAVRRQLDRMVSSDLFVHGPRQVRFLTYIVEATLDGQAHRLNQFAIGVEVFDRDEEFDPSADAIVRVEAGRLRSKLAEYYAGPGNEDRVVISMPKGGYGVTLQFRNALPAEANASEQSDVVLRRGLVISVSLVAILLGSVYVGFFRAPEPYPEPRASPNRTTPAIAVLPFDNMSDDPGQEYFSDGITEDIITDLSILSGLTVIARHSTFVYKGQSLSIGEIGRDLGVQYVLEGSVRKDENRIRITAQLIDVGTEGHIWAERFDRELNDVFALQDEVSRKIAEALQVTLTQLERERLGHRGTLSVEAHDFLLRGQEQFYRFTGDGVDAAIDSFESAYARDPKYAAAYAWHARALVYARISGFKLSHSETIDAAIAIAERAMRLDERLPMAHANLGWALRWDGDAAGGLSALSRAIELEPSFADAYLWQSLILSTLGRGGEALAAIDNSLRLDPNYSVTHVFALGRAHVALGGYDEALLHFERGIERNPNFIPNHVYKMFALEALGREQAAAAAEQTLAIINPAYKRSASYETYQKERTTLRPNP